MKKLILFISIVAAVVSCNPKQETKQVAFQMPAVDDIAEPLGSAACHSKNFLLLRNL